MELSRHFLLHADKGMCGYLQAVGILLLFLPGLLLTKFSLMLSFKLELGDE